MKTHLFGKALAALALTAVLLGCNLIHSVKGSESNEIKITALSLQKSSALMKVGTMDYIAVSVKPQDVQKDVKLKWEYDESILQCDTNSAWGATLTALKEGQTALRCSYGGYDANCIVTVSGFADSYEETVEPYIYSNTTIIQTSPGVTEKVYVSLFGGSAADIDGYTWTCDNMGVCTIDPTGQYCLVTAKDTGYARIKVTHSKAQYPYYMGIYVFNDASKVPYITTVNNIVTMKQGDASQNVSVSLMNGKEGSLDSQFVWEIVNDGADTPVRVETNGNKAIVTPLKGGSCTLRVTHPDAAYPLDMLCRVLTIVKNVYIKPSSTVVNLHGEETQTVTFSLENIKDGEYDIGAYEYTLDSYSAAEIVSAVGNQVVVKGHANGSCKLVATHESAAYPREVLLIVDGQLTDAVDASTYITTSQNYIRTKVGAEPTKLNISLKGGEDGDEVNFIWSVKSTAADGSLTDVVNVETTHGDVIGARMAAQTYAYGEAMIEPLAEGTAVITITHPKIVYPTEVLVKVLDRNAILEEPLYFTGDGLVKILNGESAQYTVSLLGKNKQSGDDNGIKWAAEDSRICINAAANVANISAPPLGTGCTTSNITASHNKADADKKVLVMTADDQETLDSMRALYSDKLYYNISIGDRTYLMASTAGFDDEDGGYDFSGTQWTAKDPSVVSVEKSDYPLTGIATGLKAGTTTVTACVGGCSVEFTVTVYPQGAVQTEPEVYFTTSQNVITLGKAGSSATVYASAINLPASKYGQIEWDNSNESVATVVGNGTSATVTAVAEGESVLSVSHPQSQNTLKIYVRVGSEYVIKDAEPVVYISSQDVLTMLRDEQAQRLDAVLVNYDSPDKAGFLFSIDDSSVARISSQSTNGMAYIEPVSAGQAEITISHNATELTKKVLVVVGNTAEELAGITYLTTSSNVVSIGEGNTRNVSVSVKNSESAVLDGYSWTSSAPEIIGVTASGANALLTGNKIGTAMITVTNSQCKYPLQIIAQCIDPVAAAQSPYIQLTSSVLTVNVSPNYTNITAELVGGTNGDASGFVWTTQDSSICTVYGQNETGKLRAMKAGTTYITVSHPKAVYPAQLLVVCDEVKQSDCYISVPASIMNMKPTDSTQTVTASLINGNETDKYNFGWSCDVYDVVDLVYSANTATITPKQQGQCTITITHPKAAYPQQIVVTVQEYSSFAFPNTNTSITAGDVKFYTMQIPNTRVATHVEYSVDNPSICTISGTKSTAQITAISDGTTTVHAKLVASSTGAAQAQSDMLVYVKKAPVDAVYITSSMTISTLDKGKSMTLSAALTGTGVTSDDRNNLKWTTSDSDIVQITGISSDGTIRGQQIYITALKPGEALITCSHDKAASDLQFFVVVPGDAEKIITLNKTYITIQKDGSGATLKANIENSESSSDYYDIEWKVENVGGVDVCRVMGSGQTVTIYPLHTGEADVIASLPNSSSVAKCQVKVEAGRSFVFDQTAVKVQPFESYELKYTISPPDAGREWTMSQTESFFTYEDKGPDAEGRGIVVIHGIGTGSGYTGIGSLSCRTTGQSGGATGQVNVTVGWDYRFSLNRSSLYGTPDEKKTIGYTVSPANATILMDYDERLFRCTLDESAKEITVEALRETGNSYATISITAQNPANGDKIGGQNVSAKFVYEVSTSVISVALASDNGGFSKYTPGQIVLGDGETAYFKAVLDTKGGKLNAEIGEVRVKNVNNGLFKLDGTNPVSSSTKEFTLKHTEATDLMGYRVTKAYRPVYRPDGDGGDIVVSSGTEIDWKEMKWIYEDDDYNMSVSKDCDSYYGLVMPSITIIDIDTKNIGGTSHYKEETVTNLASDNKYVCFYHCLYDCRDTEDYVPPKFGKYFAKMRDTSLEGKWYSFDEFKTIAWWYVPEYKSNTCHGCWVETNEQIIESNVTAELSACDDQTVVSGGCIGQVEISWKHNGQEQTPATFNVYQEVRLCGTKR